MGEGVSCPSQLLLVHKPGSSLNPVPRFLWRLHWPLVVDLASTVSPILGSRAVGLKVATPSDHRLVPLAASPHLVVI